MVDKASSMAVTLPTSVRVLMPHGRVEEMKLETYLAGVVATEIGATAPLESLKAQAVASRTYAAAAHRHPEHDADLCTTAHCQKWKHVDPVVAPEVFRALSETWGMVAIFDGKLVDAFFFEHCDGHTRNSEEMLMPSVKYLRGVDCSCGFLSLKGHGVGMCKRGAIVMARRGASFEQILRHYYRGVVVIHTAHENHVAPEPEPEPPATVIELPAPAAIEHSAPPVEAAAPMAEPAASKPRVRVRKARAPASAEKIERKRPVTRKPSRRVEPSPAPVAAQAVEEKSEEIAVVVEAARAAVEPQTEKLRGVIVGEVVTRTESVAAEPPRPAKPPRRVHIDHLPGSRMIAGCLPDAGISISIEDPHGKKTMTLSGSAAHYGDGGFEAMVEEDGRYLITVDDQVVEVNVDGETVFIHVN